VPFVLPDSENRVSRSGIHASIGKGPYLRNSLLRKATSAFSHRLLACKTQPLSTAQRGRSVR
jgi:hypothetical protein